MTDPTLKVAIDALTSARKTFLLIAHAGGVVGKLAEDEDKRCTDALSKLHAANPAARRP